MASRKKRLQKLLLFRPYASSISGTTFINRVKYKYYTPNISVIKKIFTAVQDVFENSK
jgi:hypothetical protein